MLSDENKMLSAQISRSRSVSRSPERDQIIEDLKRQLVEKNDVVMSQARQIEMSKRRGAQGSDVSGSSANLSAQEQIIETMCKAAE